MLRGTLKRLNLKMIVRAHQVIIAHHARAVRCASFTIQTMPTGFKFFDETHLLTVSTSGVVDGKVDDR